MVFQKVLRSVFWLIVGTSSALAQSETDSTPSATRSFHLGVFGGPLDVSTDVKREVDKKGTIAGINLVGGWNIYDAFASFGLGYLVSSAKGSSSLTMGDQTATISSPFVDVNAGYRILSHLSLAIGIQSWFGKGGNFSPEEDSEKYKIYYYAEINIHPAMTQPFAFNLRYLSDLNISDRIVTAITAGISYQISL